MALTTADLQDIAREFRSRYGKVWHASDAHGSGTTGLSWQDPVTLAYAAANAAEGDAVLMAAEDFDFVAAAMTCASPGVHYLGSGSRTVLKSTIGSDHFSTVVTFIRANSRCIFENFTINHTPASDFYGAPIGDNGQARSNVELRKLHIIGTTDGIYFTTAGSSLFGYELLCESNWDTFYVQGCPVYFERSAFLSRGPHSITGSSAHSQGVGQVQGGGAAVFRGCSLSLFATNSDTARFGYGIRVAGTNSRAELHQSTVLVDVPDGTNVFDLSAASGGKILVAGTSYNASRTLGTIVGGATLGANGYPAVDAVYVGGKLANIFGNAGQPCTITIDDPSAVPGAAVWVTSDAAGHNTVAGVVYTDGSGQVTFLLVPGTTYYLWMSKAGENSINGQAIVAVAD